MHFFKKFLFFVFLYLQLIFAQDIANNSFDQGMQYFYSLQFEQAISHFQKTIQKDADFLLAYEKVFQCYKALGKLSEAKSYFEMLQKEHPENSLPWYAIGKIYLDKKEYNQTIKPLLHSIDLKPEFHANVFSLVVAYSKSGEINQVERLMGKRIKVNPKNSFAHYGLGAVFYFQGQSKNALSSLNQSLKLNPLLLDAYHLKAVVFRDQTGDLKQALAVCDQAYSLARENGNVDFAITFLLDKASVLQNAGESEKAIAVYQQAIEESEKAKLIDRKAEALSNLGVVYRQMGKNEQALKVLRKSLPIFDALRDAIGLQKVISNIGDVYLTIGQMDSAQVYYAKALIIAKKEKLEKDIAASYGQFATLYFYLGNYKRSAVYSDSAISLYRKINYKPGLAAELGNLGTVYYISGQYEKAIQYFNDASEQAQSLNDLYLQEINLGNMGSIYYLLKDLKHAQVYLQKAYQIAKQIPSPSDEATWLGSLSTVWLEMGDTTKAILNLKEALNILTTVNDLRNMAITYANLGTIYTLQKNYELAEQHFRKALTINEDIKNAFGIAETHNNLGTLNLFKGQYDPARKEFQMALEEGKKLSSPKTMWDAFYGLGRVEEKSGNLTTAIDFYKKAVEITESIRGQLISTGLKTSFLTSKVEIYHQLINALYLTYQQNRDVQIGDEAFHYAEQVKARTLLDLLSESRIEIRKGVDPELLSSEKSYMQSISEIQTQLATAQLTAEQRNRLLTLLQEHEDNLQKIRTEIRAQNPFYAQIKFPAVVQLKEVQNNLPDNTFLLEYVLGKTHSYLWVISKNKKEWLQLPPGAKIAAQINRYLKMISRPPQIGSPLKAYGENLARLILSSVQNSLPENARLVIIPDGELHYLPFETLIIKNKDNKKEYLVESHAISYASSASVLLFLTRRAKPTEYGADLLAFGDPVFSVKDTMPDVSEQFYRERGLGFKRLPYTSSEVKQIARLFPGQRTKVYLGEQATEENVKAESGQDYRILHFATHGMIDEKTPQRSCILLSIDNDPGEDGFLQVQEIFDLKLKAQLVTLSACQTGRGKLVKGEGIIGFSQAFYYSGARSLLVSLWPVADQSTAELMSKFYDFLKETYSEAEALRQAKIRFIKGANRTLRHPYFWAPFVLHGAIE